MQTILKHIEEQTQLNDDDDDENDDDNVAY